MSRAISEILQAPEPQFSQMLKDWERISGNPAHDLRLLSEMNQAVKQVLSELSLDQKDTLPEELYYALRQKAWDDNAAFSRHLSITRESTPAEVVEKIINFVNSQDIQREVWAVKPSVIKEWLKKQPPKKLLKALKLKSIDSVLKRTKPAEILSLAYDVESPEWCSKVHSCYKNLSASDLQEAKSEVLVVSKNYVEKIQAAGFNIDTQPVKPLYEAGVVLVITPRNRYEGDVLAITLALLQALINIRVYSAYFRFISVKKNFGSLLLDSVRYGFRHSSLRMKNVEWPIFQKHLIRSPRAFAIYEQPHFHFESVVVHDPLEVLAEFLPAFDFWQKNSSVVFAIKNKPVSCHIVDVVTNGVNRSTYQQGELSHLRARLWEELCLRYLAHEELEKHLFDEL